jgi:hypothetical protein
MYARLRIKLDWPKRARSLGCYSCQFASAECPLDPHEGREELILGHCARARGAFLVNQDHHVLMQRCERCLASPQPRARPIPVDRNMAEISTVNQSKELKKDGVDQIELVASNTSSNEENAERAHMTTTKWLALIALGLSYMTAFQQGACTAAIVKSIDEALGYAASTLS